MDKIITSWIITICSVKTALPGIKSQKGASGWKKRKKFEKGSMAAIPCKSQDSEILAQLG